MCLELCSKEGMGRIGAAVKRRSFIKISQMVFRVAPIEVQGGRERMNPRRWLLLLLMACMVSGLLPAGVGVQEVSAADTLLWRVGKADLSYGEFSDFAAAAAPYDIPSDWNTRTDWKAVPKGLKGSINKELALRFNLAQIPANGVKLTFKILDADRSVPQMAVFANDMMAGLIQIAGVSGSTHLGLKLPGPVPFKETYQLYIPKELLQTGTNVLKLQAPTCLFCSSAEEKFLWWSWDYLMLESLEAPAAEPIHGRVVYTGTMINEDYRFTADATRHLPALLKWLGIAYSGNALRAGCASDVSNSCTDMENFFKTMADYNMKAVGARLNTRFDLVNGALPPDKAAILENYLSVYGKYLQYYEVDNEPGLFNIRKSVDLAVARWLRDNRAAFGAPDLKIVAPGWAYQPAYAVDACDDRWQVEGQPKTCGTPDGWEADPVQRKEVEDVTDLTNGHAYAMSYGNYTGGSLVENLLTFSTKQPDGTWTNTPDDGLPKDMLNTEFGTSNGHMDLTAYGALAHDSQAAIFDRVMRAHVGFADTFLQHAAFFNNYQLFRTGFVWETHDPAQTEIFYNTVSAEPEYKQDPRVKTFRRLALAYATHGQPLAYTYLNKSSLLNRKVLFRGVNTAALAPLPVTNAKSNKVLLNFVNFENTAQTMQVRVTLPKEGIWTGERIGAGDTYAAASQSFTGYAGPALDLTVALGPGESVQYILEPPEGTPLDRTGWTASDGVNSGTAALQNALDRNTGTRWSSGAVQSDGQKFIVDMKSAKTFNKLILWESSNDYPRGYEVYVSNDGVTWGTPVASGAGATGTTTVTFPQKTARYIKVEINLPADFSRWWSIHEFLVLLSGDVSAPAAPAGLVAETVKDTTVTLKWNASASPDTVGYDIYRGSTPVGSTTYATAYKATGLTGSTYYSFTVVAKDAAGNRSASSAALPVTTAQSPLSRSAWVAEASHTASGSNVKNAIDGVASSRWSLGTAQTNDPAQPQYYKVDMGTAVTFKKLVLDTMASAGDYPRGYALYVSNDGTNWGTPVAQGTGSALLTIQPASPVTARYFKVVQNGSAGVWWSIHELNAYD